MHGATTKKLIVFLLISTLLLILAILLAGCGNQQNKPPAATEKTVMDMAGKNVKLPASIDRVIVAVPVTSWQFWAPGIKSLPSHP
ncbi:hypothetical protein MOOR_23350 [Moorella thermoacetica]|uniref:Uncharacterized protein n=1 Tax=Neomoorella thermoacetica TaxID=1525 RepID=A0A1J5JTZ8_NEOTH|nr:hypothetical protein [Moorella thermoacetica]OIQ08055.1 hypothetical protein MOOR_23350 [Moorella thermoacetica]